MEAAFSTRTYCVSHFNNELPIEKGIRAVRQVSIPVDYLHLLYYCRLAELVGEPIRNDNKRAVASGSERLSGRCDGEKR